MNKQPTSNQPLTEKGAPTAGTTRLEQALLGQGGIRLIAPAVSHRPKISSITAEESRSQQPGQLAESPFAMKGAKLWSGNTRSLIIGMGIGALLVSFAGHVYNNHQRAIGAEPLSLKRFLQARTHTVSASSQAVIPPAPIIVQIDERLIHVSAIALGHPRLAVINGQTVAEGDYVKVRAANPAVTASLRVVKIGEGRIDLSDGIQTITTQLSISSPGSR